MNFCLPNDAHALVRFDLAQRGIWFYSRTLASRVVLGEKSVSCGMTQSNQVKNWFYTWFYTVTPCRTNQKLLGTTRHSSTFKTARRL